MEKAAWTPPTSEAWKLSYAELIPNIRLSSTWKDLSWWCEVVDWHRLNRKITDEQLEFLTETIVHSSRNIPEGPV